MPLYLVIAYRKRSSKNKQSEDDFINTLQTASELGLKTDINPLLFIIPTLIDVVSSTCGLIALNFVEASIYLMMNGCGFLWIVLFSKLVLKRKLYRHHYTSIPLIFIGVTTVGYASLKEKGVNGDSKWIGFIFIFFTQIFGALFYISEEFLLRKYYIHPLKVVGWEGVWGCLIYVAILAILQFIK